MVNTALRKIRNGETAFGFALGLGSPLAAEIAANAGFDWIWIDAQHGAFYGEELMRSLQVMLHTPTSPIVRPGSNDFYRIGWVLDAGAHGVVVPMVNSPEEAQAAVYAAKYPPTGTRSGGGPRLALFGADYHEVANDETLVAVQIETPQAVEAAHEIAAVEGVDCLFVGPGDLRYFMQVEAGSPEHEAAIARVLEVAEDAGKCAAYPCNRVEEALKRADQGFRLVTCGSDNSTMNAGIASILSAIGR